MLFDWFDTAIAKRSFFTLGISIYSTPVTLLLPLYKTHWHRPAGVQMRTLTSNHFFQVHAGLLHQVYFLSFDIMMHSPVCHYLFPLPRDNLKSHFNPSVWWLISTLCQMYQIVPSHAMEGKQRHFWTRQHGRRHFLKSILILEIISIEVYIFYYTICLQPD